MAEQYGYTGKILKIDLTNRQVTEIQSSDYLPKYFGGRSLAAKLYWDEMPPEVGALDPESALIFTTGPLTGTGASMASVSQCAGKSARALSFANISLLFGSRWLGACNEVCRLRCIYH